MSDDASIVKKDIGGVPLWVWGGGVAGVIILYTFFKRAQSGSSSQVVAATGTDATPLDSSLNDFTQSDTGTTSVASTLTNSQWLSNAEQALEQQGYDPLTILSTLSSFINGDTITPGSQQAQIVSAALASQGTPPDLNSGVSVSSPATSTSSDAFNGIARVTGDPVQDQAIAASSYVKEAYEAAIAPGATAADVNAYEGDVNKEQYTLSGGTLGSATGQQFGS